MTMITERNNCVGCASCLDACPSQSIQMKEDQEGFLYPIIDTETCINCGACQKVCPARQERVLVSPQAVVAVTSKDNTLLRKSSSGGLFSLLVNAFLLQHPNAYVYGAALDEDFKVYHKYIRETGDLWQLCESKYVQSRCQVYAEIRALLDAGEFVYFSGTLCQVAALRSFLSKEYDNLFTQGVLCHGVPSPGLWAQYVEQLKNQHDSPLTGLHFRDKEHGWEKYGFSAIYADGVKIMPKKEKLWYVDAYFSNFSLRPACYNCQYKFPNYYADIVIGDFWNVKQYCPDAYHEQGVSLAIIVSNRGAHVFDSIKEDMSVHYVTMENAIRSQRSIIEKVKAPRKRAAWWADIAKKSPQKVTKRYTRPSLYRVVRAKAAKTYRNLIYFLRK